MKTKSIKIKKKKYQLKNNDQHDIKRHISEYS